MSQRASVCFDFAFVGESGVLDQMMTLQYSGPTTAVPVIAYQAVDRSGSVLAGVSVHSCYGSDRGEMVLTPGENTDLLYLRGDGIADATDVVGTVTELRPQDRRENPVTQVVPTDADGHELAPGGGFDHLTVFNPWGADALCHVVAVALDAPASGPQGAVDVVRMTPQPVVVPGNTQLRLAPPAELHARISRYFGSAFVTVKTYPAAG